MEERLEYNYRGLGVLTLCVLLFAVGIWRFGGGTAPVSSTFGGKAQPVCSVITDKKQVSLTFDTVGGNGDIQEILNILAKYQIKATFFITGEWVKRYPEDVKRILAGGHDLGNHTQNHENMKGLTEEECQKEMLELHAEVKALTGYDMFLFRSPYGNYDNRVLSCAKECGYYAVQGNVDSLDWKNYGTRSILETVLDNKELGNGSIILCRRGGKYTVQALEQLILGLQKKGFGLVPVSSLIYKENYYIDQEGRQGLIQS